MSFIDALSDAWDSVKEKGSEGLGIAMDFAKSDVGEPMVGVFLPGHGAAQASKPVQRTAAKQYDRFQEAHPIASRRLESTAKYAVKPAIEAGEALQWVTNKGQRVVTTAELMTGGSLVAAAPTAAVNILRGETMSPSEAWATSDKVTPGQAAIKQTFGAADAVTGAGVSEVIGTDTAWDTLGKVGRRGDEEFNPVFSLASGAIDAGLVWMADPLVLAGRAATVARKSKTMLRANDLLEAEARAGVGKAVKPTRRQAAVADELDDFVENTVGKPVEDLMRYDAFKKTNHGAALASLMSAADTPEQGKLIWLTAQGSVSAKKALVAQRADIGFKVDRLTSDLTALVAPDVRYAGGLRLPGRFTDEEKNALKLELESDTRHLDLMDRALGDMDKQSDLGRRLSQDEQGVFGAANGRRSGRVRSADLRRSARSASYTIQSGLGGVPMRVLRSPVERRPLGGFDRHDADAAFQEIDRASRQLKNFDPAERQHWLARMATAQDDNARDLAYRQFEDRAIQHIGEQYRYTPDEIKSVLKKLREEKDAHLRGFKERNFGVLEDGTTVLNPLSETQLANYVTSMDLHAVDRIFARNAPAISGLRAGLGSKFDFAEHAADTMNDLWKFSVLFRGGYMQRNAIDGQIRLMATIHGREALVQHRETLAAWRKMRSLARGEMKASPEEMSRPGFTKRHTGVGFNRPTDAAKAKAEAALADSGDLLPRSEYGDYYIAHPDGETIDEVRINRMLNDPTDHNWAVFATESANKKLNEWRGTGDWVTLAGHEERWTDSYLRTVNNHLREGEISKRLLKGESPAEVLHWLKSAEGRAVRRRMIHGWDSPEDLVQANVENLNHLVPEEMRPLFAERNATAEDVRKMWKNEADRPAVNAEQVAFSMGRGKLAEGFDNLRSEYFRRFNSMPDTALSQHPMYRAFYRGKMRQELARLDPTLSGHLTVAEQRVMEAQARTFARREMRRLSFDASNKSNLGHFLRFTSPFYTAWEDVLVKYNRMVMDDPTLIPHAWQVWSAPNDASFLEVVDLQTHKPVSGEKSQIGNQEGIVLAQTGGVLGKLLNTASGGVYNNGIVSKGGFNVVLQGDPWYLPGVGPIAQATLQDVAVGIDSPRMAGWLEKTGVLPFGVQDKGWMGIEYLEPTAIAALHPSSGQLGKLGVMIATEEEYKYRTHQRDTQPSPGEIRKKVWIATALKAMTKFTAPASVQYQNPHQFYIDQYHAMLENTGKGRKFKDTLEADKAFYDKYGEDVYLFSTSMAENNAKVGATRSAYKTYQGVKDLVAKHAEFGDYFIGPNNYGTFDRNVYGLEQMKTIDPVTRKKMRDTYDTPFEALAKTNAEIGWNEYVKLNDELEAIRMDRGLDSLQSAGAEDLAQIKSDWIESIHGGKDSPAWGEDWYDDFKSTDGNKVHRFLLAAKVATEDPRTRKRPDVKLMADLLDAREQIRAELKRRGSKTLPDANQAADGSVSFGQSKNADLAQIWHAYGASLADQNPTFATVWTRYLERDNLQDGV